MHFTVGALANASGLTVRTLHHWDEIGLLRPAERSAAGHRRYSPGDVERVYRIVALRRLGLSLEEVGAALDEEGPDLHTAVRTHLGRVEAELARTRALEQRLRGILDAFDRLGEPSTEQIIDVIEVMTMTEQLDARATALGDETMERTQRDWGELIAAIDAERRAGTDPAHPRVQALAERWRALMYAFTGGDDEIHTSVNRVYAQQPARGGMIPEVLEYVRQAFDAATPR
jgi:DNA-binding transcriptional MerR regulator